jgi:hypothetical protein
MKKFLSLLYKSDIKIFNKNQIQDYVLYCECKILFSYFAFMIIMLIIFFKKSGLASMLNF